MITIVKALAVGFVLSLLVLFFRTGTENNHAKSEKTQAAVPQNLKTVECTSVAGTTMTFSLQIYPEDNSDFNSYHAVDKNGVPVAITALNYGQWKCKE